MPPDPQSAAAPHRAPDLIELLAQEVRALVAAERRGDLADLRRMDPARPDAPAFFRMLVRHQPDAGPAFTRRCAHLVKLLALRPEALSSGALGQAMATHGVSEARVQRLLAARGDALVAQIDLVARRLSGERDLPYRELGRLLLADDDDERAEAVRLGIARDYFRSLDRAEAGPAGAIA